MSDPKLVPVKAPDGSIGTVAAVDLDQALEAGAEVVAPEVLKRAELEAKYGDAGGVALAAVAGGARGLSLGTSDAILTGLDPSLRDPLNALREVNPIASMGGEIVGAVAPTLFTGGAAAAARGGLSVSGAVRGLGALPRGVTALGGMAERGVARMVGEGATGILARAAQRGASLGTRGAVEGAFFGAGHEVSEAALGGAEITAEKLMAGARGGALAGLAVGGGLGASGSLLKSLASTASELVPGGVRKAASEFAEERAFKATDPSVKFQRSADRVQGGAKVVGRHMLDELPAEMGKPFAAATAEEIGEAAGRRAKFYGEKLGSMFTTLDEKAAPELRPNVGAIRERIEQEVLAPLRAKAFHEDIVRSVESRLSSLDRFTEKGAAFEGIGGQVANDVSSPLGFSKLHKLRRELDERINWKGPPTPEQEPLRAARAIIEDELEQGSQRAAESLGDTSFVHAYKDAKLRFQSMSVARDAAADSVQRAARNRSVSPSDYIAGAAGFIAGSPVAAVAGAVGNKVLRERGNQILADVADRVSRLRAVELRVQGVDSAITRGVTTFFATDTAPVAIGKAKPLRDTYTQRVAELSSFAASPNRIASKMAERIGDLADHAPNVSAAAAALEARKVAFLASKIPARHRPTEGVLQPQFAKPRVSDLDMARFMRFARAADDPLTIVSDLENGRVSREAVETVKALYPSIYETIRTRVTEQLASAKGPLAYQKQIQLGILFDAKTHPSLEPAFIRVMQEQWETKKAQQQQGRPGALSLGAATQTMATGSERVEGK